MSDGLTTRLISKLRDRLRPRDCVAAQTTRGAVIGEDLERAYLFTDMLAASALLDFGGMPIEFQLRERRPESTDTSVEARRR